MRRDRCKAVGGAVTTNDEWLHVNFYAPAEFGRIKPYPYNINSSDCNGIHAKPSPIMSNIQAITSQESALAALIVSTLNLEVAPEQIDMNPGTWTMRSSSAIPAVSRGP